jgi:hypothetical protein
MALAAVLDTAWNWWRIRNERQHERDPSEDQDLAVLAPALREDVVEARILLHRLRMEIVAVLVRSDSHMKDAGLLLAASRLTPVFHRIHQRLLSLYPGIDETTVESSRLLESSIRTLLDGETDHPAERARTIVDSGTHLLNRIEASV